ncbi:MAG TPA: hypothetical protein VF841_05110 [Anaeromyxobacter sp.]
MTDWGRRAAGVVAAVLAVSLGGCESPLGPPATSSDVLSGDWSACLNDGTGDHATTLNFYPDASYLLARRTFATTDRTCGGAQTGATYEAWRYRLGNEVPANIGPGGTPVTAREIDIMNSRVTIYSIVYEDIHATPQVLYFGDLALDPALDGSAAAKRPNVLSATTSLSAY